MNETETPNPVRIRTGEYPLQLREAVVQFELAFLAKALDRHDGNVSRTAVSLGVTRRTLQLKIKRCGLNQVPRKQGTTTADLVGSAFID